MCRTTHDEVCCNIICLTHDHDDHLGDAFEIGKRNNAVIVAIHEIAKYAASKVLRTKGMNIGGTIVVGDWHIKMVEALHFSNMGAGFILKRREFNKTIYQGIQGFSVI